MEFDIVYSTKSKNPPVTQFEISQDHPCMNRKDTFSTDTKTLEMEFFQRQEFENSLFMENDEYIKKYKGVPVNMKNGCTNSPNFIKDYKQIRHFPPGTDLKLI